MVTPKPGAIAAKAPKAKAAPAKRGRPCLYTEDLAAEICERLAAGETLRQICQSDHIPSHGTVIGWCDEGNPANPAFANRYARARSEGLDVMAQEMIAIADQDRICEKVKRDGEGNIIETTVVDMVERSRLQLDARKWLLSKMRPDKYGDRTTLAGDPNAPLAPPVINVNFLGPK